VECLDLVCSSMSRGLSFSLSTKYEAETRYMRLSADAENAATALTSSMLLSVSDAQLKTSEDTFLPTVNFLGRHLSSSSKERACTSTLLGRTPRWCKFDDDLTRNRLRVAGERVASKLVLTAGAVRPASIMAAAIKRFISRVGLESESEG